MTNNEYQNLKNNILYYINTNDKQTLENIICMHNIYIEEYLKKCKYIELEKDEIISIIVLNIIEFIKYVDLSININKYEKKIKDSIKKCIFKEVRKCKIYNNKESYEYYVSQHKNGEERSYIDPNISFNIKQFIYELPIQEQQFIMTKYGFNDGIQKTNLELKKIYNKSIEDIEKEDIKILKKLRTNIKD